MSVTLKDVAEKLGVTITTVHKALNGKEGVSEKRRAEIMKVAAQMGYKVNYMASSLSKKNFTLQLFCQIQMGITVLLWCSLGRHPKLSGYRK